MSQNRDWCTEEEMEEMAENDEYEKWASEHTWEDEVEENDDD